MNQYFVVLLPLNFTELMVLCYNESLDSEKNLK